jgi:3-isopropylmalate/(R)-2-methylmalate dehydratase small subunit
MMPFTSLTGIAAAVPIANIDTDMLFPAAFLRTTSRKGLRDALFANLRAEPGFPLNHDPWCGAKILVTLDNLGCGSSREHAPWALLDFGIRCVIAPSFADIFHGNCFKNGLLPVELNPDQVEILLADASDPSTAEMIVDLDAQFIIRASGEQIAFQIDPEKRRRLLAGLDDIALTLEHTDSIARYAANIAQTQPWIKPLPATLP